MSSAAIAIGSDKADDAPIKKGGKKKLMLLAVPLVLAGVGSGLWFSGVLPHMLGREHAAKSETEGKPAVPVFVDLPEMIANLNAKRPSYVKVVARLEVAKPEDAERVKAVMPRIVDLFQTYLREMRPEELRGSAGTHRLREELIARASIATAPTRVIDVLFSEMIVQ
jgi:flagellar FliL protein